MLKDISKIDLILLLLVAAIIIAAEYLFLTGNELHGIFLGLWAPTVLGIMIVFKLIDNGRK